MYFVVYVWDSVEQDVSDRLEKEPDDSLILRRLEQDAKAVVGTAWNDKLPPELLADVGQYRRYNFGSVRDCIRMIRNKRNHFTEIPATLRSDLFGDSPVALVPFILHPTRFPRLLMAAYDTTLAWLADEEVFQQYLGRITSKQHGPGAAQAKASMPRAHSASTGHKHGNSSGTGSNSAVAANSVPVPAPVPVKPCVGWFKELDGWLAATTMQAQATLDVSAHMLELGTEVGVPAPGSSSRGRLIAGVACLKETKYKGGAKVWDPRYKSMLCANWEGSGGAFCPRGLRCDFAHGPVELRKLDLLKLTK